MSLSRIALAGWLLFFTPLGLLLLTSPAPDGAPLVWLWLFLTSVAIMALWWDRGCIIPGAIWGITIAWLQNPGFSGSWFNPVGTIILPLAIGGILGTLMAGFLEIIVGKMTSRRQ